jgi:hypothetical protein
MNIVESLVLLGSSLSLLRNHLLVLLEVRHLFRRYVVVDGQTGRVVRLYADLPHLAHLHTLEDVGQQTVGAAHDVLHQVRVAHVESSHLQSAALKQSLLDWTVADHGVGVAHQVVEVGLVRLVLFLETFWYFLAVDGERIPKWHNQYLFFS